MSDKKPLNVVLMWHMHQPEYRDLRSGEYQLPWTYLHGIKDYVDMVAHLEDNPDARAVVNFAPVLLEQLDDYVKQINNYLQEGAPIRDRLLNALAEPALTSDLQKQALINDCLRVNEQRVIKRFKPFKKLVAMAHHILKQPAMLDYLEEQFVFDLVTWYHLGWIGETVRRSHPEIERLQEKGHLFTVHERRQLLEVIGKQMASIIPRYRQLAEAGRIELTTTPYAHPIVPLLLDIGSTLEAMPDAKLPALQHYPGGEERARWHVQKGLEVFEQHFGFRPSGCWPSEGSVSAATLTLLKQSGFEWIASGGSVLHNSINAAAPEELPCIHSAYQVGDNPIRCFFRDDGLSDMVGFNYSEWHADDAVANLVHHLENIADACDNHQDSIVSIILDGENAWEYYPENGFYFLQALYKQLSDHPGLNLTTYHDFLSQPHETITLPTMVAGSWVYGTFSTWIGDKDKNRAWDMLGDAKQAFDEQIRQGSLSGEARAKAELQLAICEGSDWFWWFGDYNPSDTVSDFEHLFRLNLSILYGMLGVEAPGYLSESFTHGSGAPAMGGTMRRGQEMQ